MTDAVWIKEIGEEAMTQHLISDLPRRIHQIWFGELFPDKYSRNRNTYQALVKQGWEYRLWNDADAKQLVEKEYPQFADTWQTLDEPTKKADCFRYLLMHHFGGMYADVDSYLIGDISNFLVSSCIEREDYSDDLWPMPQTLETASKNYDILLGAEKVIWDFAYDEYGLAMRKVNNAVLLSRPKLDFWLELVQFCLTRSGLSILNSFGVHTFTFFVYSHLLKAWPSCSESRMRKSQYPRIFIVPPLYFNLPEPACDSKQVIVHTYDGRWHD